ncbi:hypothetical protein SAY86_015209 [Trapa natans]|uniref:Uncharacterized protein n=1 Tax=Trapa natans TaxID=22666 RepID=A0AAN7KLM3_TRANT|nr:hypothetical protein SAY86_015209 [Trapa natans]
MEIPEPAKKRFYKCLYESGVSFVGIACYFCYVDDIKSNTQPTVNQYGSVDSGNAPNGHVPPYERSLTPILHDFTDLSMCYIPNGYPSAAYYFEGK